jgi:Holliday junction resolvasome RuvABC endonuclease subunit
MNVLGVDPSSSCTGIAYAVDGSLKHIEVWKPKKGSGPARLYDYYSWIQARIGHYMPHGIVLELCAVARNTNTVRILARYEGATILSARARNIPIVETRVSKARSIAYGKGDLKKPAIYKILTEQYSDLDWLPGTDKGGGLDQADAATLAIAGPDIIEGA